MLSVDDPYREGHESIRRQGGGHDAKELVQEIAFFLFPDFYVNGVDPHFFILPDCKRNIAQ